MLCPAAAHLGGKRHEASRLDWSDLKVLVTRKEIFTKVAALYRVLYIACQGSLCSTVGYDEVLSS
jgi:hypothetical protein